MKKIIMSTFLILAVNFQGLAGNYSLKQCINFARNNNSNIKTAKLDSAVSEKKVKELVGTGLPQIEASGSLTDNLKINTQMMPAEMMGGAPGTYFAVQMGTKYDFSGKVSLNQKLLDFSFWVGLDAAKLSSQMSGQTISKQEEQIDYNVTSAYYKAVVLQMQLGNLKDILASSEKTLKSTEIKYQNGAAKKIEVDKIKVSYNNTKSQLLQTELNLKKAINNLKFQMGMPLETQLTLTDSLNSNFSSMIEDTKTIDSNKADNRIDYQIQKTNILLQEANKKNNETANYPTISLNASYGVQAMREQFDFLNFSKDWFSNAAVGLTLRIPIFTGLSNQAKIEQSEINIEKEKENLKYMEQSIKVDISNYYIQLKNAIENIQNEKNNLELALSVFSNTQIEFSLGKTSSLELVQAESTLRETQNNYYSRLLDLYLAQLDLEKNKGTLNNFINNIK